MQDKIKSLREEVARLESEQRDIFRNAKNEGRVPTKEEEEKFDKIEVDVISKRQDVERYEKMAKVEAQEAEKRYNEEKQKPKADLTSNYRTAFWKYAQRGYGSLSPSELNALQNGHSAIETRGTSPQTTTDTAGGYTVPEGFSNEIEKRMLYYGGMLEAGRIFRTTDGRAITWPSVDDTGVTGARLNEDSPSVDVSDMTFGNNTLNAHTYHSKIVKVSVPLAQDSAFDLEAFLADAFSERIGRIVNTELTTGTGSGQPLGFETAVNNVSGWVTAAGASSITRGDIIDLIHGLDRVYRPNAVLMMNDATLAAIKKLAFGSGDDRPLYQSSAIAGESDRIEGYRFIVNNDMDNIGTTNTPIAFGDFQKYVIRMVQDVQMVRLQERFMDQLQLGYIAYMRLDGQLIQPNAIKLLKNA